MKKSIMLVIATSALLLVGCGNKVTDLGVVELSPDTPKHLNLGGGKDCTVTATTLANGDLQIVFNSVEKRADGKTPPGVPAGTSTRLTQTMIVPSGVAIMGSVAHQEIRFTPKLKAP